MLLRVQVFQRHVAVSLGLLMARWLELLEFEELHNISFQIEEISIPFLKRWSIYSIPRSMASCVSDQVIADGCISRNTETHSYAYTHRNQRAYANSSGYNCVLEQAIPIAFNPIHFQNSECYTNIQQVGSAIFSIQLRA